MLLLFWAFICDFAKNFFCSCLTLTISAKSFRTQLSLHFCRKCNFSSFGYISAYFCVSSLTASNLMCLLPGIAVINRSCSFVHWGECSKHSGAPFHFWSLTRTWLSCWDESRLQIGHFVWYCSGLNWRFGVWN